MKKHPQRHKARRWRRRASENGRVKAWRDLEVVLGSAYRIDTGIGFTVYLPPTPPAMKKVIEQWRSLITADPPTARPQCNLFDQDKYAEITDTARQMVTVRYGNISDILIDTDSVSRIQNHEEVTATTQSSPDAQSASSPDPYQGDDQNPAS